MDHLTFTSPVEDPLIELEVRVKTGSPNDITFEQTDEKIHINCPGDCKISVPRQARLRILRLNGNGTIKAVEGELEVQTVNGEFELRSTGPASIQLVRGNLEAKNILGSLEVKQVDGNLVIRDVQGDFVAGKVNGNLVLDDVDGSVNAHVNGNATLRLDPAPGEDYEVDANGNITCSLASDASAQLEVTRAGGRVIVALAGVADSRSSTAPYSLTLGDGDARIVFSAGGNVFLNSQAPDWNGMPEMEFGADFGSSAGMFADQITRQIESQMHMLEQQLTSQLANLSVTLGSAGMTSEQIERIQERARQAGERVSARAQEKINQAQERLEHKLAQVQRHAERQARVAEARARAAQERAHHREHRAWRGMGPEPPTPPAPPQEPVREEERLVILRMLQDKKISLQEAESLLAALEGRESE